MNGENSISVVLPVFNSENSVAECIKNALCSLREFDELIIIDDGSTDKTQQICLNYARENDNVIYIHQENKGAFSAKLTGIKWATGKYISFIDADDVCAENRFNVMHAVVEDSEADIIFFGATIKKIGFDTKIYDTDMLPGSYTGKQIFEQFGKLLFGKLESDENPYTGYLWNTLIKRDVISGIQTYANESIQLYGDDIIMLYAVLNAEKCTVSEKKLYCYEHLSYNGEGAKKVHWPKKWENIATVYCMKRKMAIDNNMYNSEIQQRLATFLGPISFMRFIMSPATIGSKL